MVKVLSAVLVLGLGGAAIPFFLGGDPAPPVPAPAPLAVAPVRPGAAIIPAGIAVPSPAAGQPQPSTTGKLPVWQRLGVPATPAEGRPTIAIMIDDMGVNRVQSDRAVRLPAPLTLSWLPYAANVTDQAAIGAANGHETMLHMPMEPLGRTDPGPNALRTWLPAETNLANLRTALDKLPNAVGLNQHEGSVASLSVPLMDMVMGELKARDLLFVDSLTIPHSVALRRAEAAGVAAIPRNVFLDNSPDPNAIRAQIAELEAVARRKGYAIAIGHPRQTTIDVLEKYLPTLASRGFVLWPVSATLATRRNVVMLQQPEE
ncbi:divergent polysaccharide deacetylase family protein [Rhodovastum atsumiense]|uniref:divergent polysaccharide deacetylase family protein n=1 Tax=Rhodovastum atsumiense TaxID=504468 RepID=UPI00139F2B53|nr:divergent polysaccharide deacetylase family protein [Rhodovastum atsumiense]